MNPTLVADSIRDRLSKYVADHNLKALVLGVSGGVDSAVCAALARPVCDLHGIDLVGRSITIASNKRGEITRAQLVGEAFCTDFKEIDLGDEFASLVKILIEDDEPGDLTHERRVRRGNLKARLRMIRLYDLASKHGGMVLSTDNLTELLLGFWTICGDVGDYGMIQKLWKSEVYAVARSLCRAFEAEKRSDRSEALQACIAAVPTDGLGVTDSDLDQFGASDYEEVERILKTWLCQDEDAFAWDSWLRYEGRPETFKELLEERGRIADHPVVCRHVATAYKRDIPISIPRHDIDGLPDE